MDEFLVILGFTVIMFLPKLLDELDRWTIQHLQRQGFDFSIDTVSLVSDSKNGIPYYLDGRFIKFLEV